MYRHISSRVENIGTFSLQTDYSRRRTMLLLVGLLFSAAVANPADELDNTATLECDGSSHTSRFSHLHALDLLYKNVSQVTVNAQEVRVTDIATLNIGHRKGSLSKPDAKLRVTLHGFDCTMIDDLKCELFGYIMPHHNSKRGEGGTRKEFFPPKIIHTGKRVDVDISVFNTQDKIHMECSTTLGPTQKESGWKWEVLAPGDRDFKAVQHQQVAHPDPGLHQCGFHSSSKVVYTVSGSGNVTFRCRIGDKASASATVWVGLPQRMNDETLGNILNVCTMILVYTHFILLPWLFSKWNNVFTYRVIHNQEDLLMRQMRTAISYAIAIAFLGISLTTCVIYWSQTLASSYLTFLIIEFLFIFGYATMRFLSNRKFFEENPQKRRLFKGRLKNARIVMSFGAVITPIICWTLIRINGGICNIFIEVLFYLTTVGAVLGFVCVSFDREGQYWDKET